MRRWIYKTDQAGKPRRFLNHREAFLWALTTVGKLFGVAALYLLVGSIFDLRGSGEVGWSMMLTLMLLAIVLAIGLLIAFAMYLYVALSGGVMDDEARRRYRNNDTLGSR